MFILGLNHVLLGEFILDSVESYLILEAIEIPKLYIAYNHIRTPKTINGVNANALVTIAFSNTHWQSYS